MTDAGIGRTVSGGPSRAVDTTGDAADDRTGGSADGVLGAGPGVVIRDLTVVLGRRRAARRAVDGLHLDLGVGVHGLLGPNGAGKTTLMRVLATVIAPTAGSVSLLGRDVADRGQQREVRRRLGYQPQSFGYHPRFTVREFVTYFAWLKEHRSPTAAADVDRAIARVGLTERADARMKALSGGMPRRAGLAQALVNAPELLLLDEPTAGLDPEQRLDFRALLRELAVDTTVVVSTHLVEDVASACTHVALMDDGRLVGTGTPAGLEDLGRAALAGGSIATGVIGADRAHEGVAAIEAGYTTALRDHRAGSPDRAVGDQQGRQRAS